MEKPLSRGALPLYAAVLAVTLGTSFLLYRVVVSARSTQGSYQKVETDLTANSDVIRARIKRIFDAPDRPSLEELYATLDDPSTSNDHPATVRMIASYGRSKESSLKLLNFIYRDEQVDIRRTDPRYWIETKYIAMYSLGFTGGENEQQFLLSVFRNGADEGLSGKWLARVIRGPGGAGWDNDLRGPAALGLIVSGNKEAKTEVYAAIDDLRARVEAGTASKADARLLRVLDGMLRFAKATDVFGPQVLLLDEQPLAMATRIANDD